MVCVSSSSSLLKFLVASFNTNQCGVCPAAIQGKGRVINGETFVEVPASGRSARAQVYDSDPWGFTPGNYLGNPILKFH